MKKVLVIASTGALPKSLRLAAREPMLARLELGIAERADLLIIGHPKSGNTWLKAMLSRLYQVRHKAVMLLARNPLDIAVSWYMQFTKRQSARKQELINHNLAHPIDRNTIGMWEFVRHSEIGLPFLIDYLNGWARDIDALPKAIIVRYEDLRHDTAITLTRILGLMGESFTPEEIAAAVEWGSFDNLRKLESEGFFRQGGMTLRNPKDPESFKVRRAKVGGYRDYFTPEQAAELEALVNERLSPVFGYTPVAAPAEAAGGS
jgi:hypothetical protein